MPQLKDFEINIDVLLNKRKIFSFFFGIICDEAPSPGHHNYLETGFITKPTQFFIELLNILMIEALCSKSWLM